MFFKMANHTNTPVVILNQIHAIDNNESSHRDHLRVHDNDNRIPVHQLPMSPVSGSLNSDIVPMFPDVKEEGVKSTSNERTGEMRQRSQSDDVDDRIRTESDRRHTIAGFGTEADFEVEKNHLDQMSVLVHTALINDDLEGLKNIYKHRKINLVDRNGNTPLHLAARKGNPQIIKWLLKCAFIPVNIKNARNETCAHHAAKLGQVKALKLIVYSGILKPITIAGERDRHGMTILHLAAILGDHEVVSWLVEAFGKTIALIRNNYGQCALHFAAAKGHVKCVYSLSRLGRQIANVKDGIGATPAFYASQEGHTQCLYYLVNTAKADLILSTDSSITPLMAAAQSGNVDAMKLILQRADENRLDQQANDGSTAFHMAAANGHAAALILLLAAQEGSHDAVRCCDVRGSSPLHDAAENGHVTCLRLLVDSDMDIHHRDEDGETPYALALRSNNAECVAYAKSLTNGQVVDPRSIFTRVHSTVAADEINRDVSSNFKPKNISEQETEDNNSIQSKRGKRKKLGFKKNRNSSSVDLNKPCHVLHGEFVLREQPIHVLSEREHRALQHQGAILSRLKFRPAPFSFPHLDEIEKDIEQARTDDKYKRSQQEDYHFPNGKVSMHPDPAPQHGHRFGPGLHCRSNSCAGTNALMGNGHSPEQEDAFFDRNHNRWQQTGFFNQPPGDNIPPLVKSLESLDLNEPNFVGAFREDDGTRTPTSRLKYPAPAPPNEPIAPPRKKRKNKKKLKLKASAKVVKDEHIYTEATDIDDVVNELHDLYASNIQNSSSGGSGYTAYMEWPEGAKGSRHTKALFQTSRPSCYQFGTDVDRVENSRISGIVSSSKKLCLPPAEPPKDYSPIVKSKSDHVHCTNVDDATSEASESNLPAPDYTDGQVVVSAEPPTVICATVIPSAPPLPPPIPPPPPPLSSNGNSEESDFRPTMPLARDLITQRSQLKKTQSSNRKSRARVRTDRISSSSVGDSISSNVGVVRDMLEGTNNHYSCVSASTNGAASITDTDASDEGVFQSTIIFASDDENTSLIGRDRSPRQLSPNTKFTYLPNGILTKPVLRKVSQHGSHHQKNSERLSTTKHTVSFQIHQQTKHYMSREHDQYLKQRAGRQHTTSENSISPASSADDEESIYSVPTPTALPRTRHSLRKKLMEKRQSLGLDISDDDYHKLESTLRMRLEKPQELPKLNMKAVRQYEKIPDPPSELELFFKRRREKLNQNNGEADGDAVDEASSIYIAGSETGSITALSKLVETEALVARQQT